jgi:hypothetical protein
MVTADMGGDMNTILNATTACLMTAANPSSSGGRNRYFADSTPAHNHLTGRGGKV